MARKKMKLRVPTETFTATVNALSHDGRGVVANPKHKTAFVSGALPGEEITFKLTKLHAKYNEGEALKIITSSPHRATPECAHFGICGGCSMQHLTMTEQILFKQQALLAQLKHFGRVEPEIILPPLVGKNTGYRRKARLGVSYREKKGKLVIGFREKSSRFLAEIDKCPILHESVSTLIPEMKTLIESLSQFENIPQIEIAIGDTQTALVFRHLTDLSNEDLLKLKHFAKLHQLELYLQPNSPAKTHKLWPEDNTERLSYRLDHYDLEMLFHPLDFTQVNAEINNLMIKSALELLDLKNTDNVLDLFCGLGNFTLPIARYAQHVTGIEGSEAMVDRAKENALHNNIANTDFYAANLAAIPATLPVAAMKKYDKVLLDPPRTGAKEIINLIPKLAPKTIVYVSCNPATLARDAGELVHKQGYKLKKIGVINMFPHTSHIEAIALFTI
ncbi:MAG: 23S rRNA (uracil(1939)-C(5))-methyltransferase RlmD [Gammaproteobacteria bacterium]|nr:23S rRNA (uracil(1939)-C(5))-methyltransferase RlmD [Gammaproteobacteria bacterium]